MLSQPPSIISQSTLPRHAVKDEAARLKAEILQQGHELAKLERLAGTVSTTRQASKLDSWPRCETSTTPSSSRSSSTGKIIEHLQREIDHLRLASQAATRSYESERRARETLRLKCDDLELSLSSLRAESSARSHTLQRSDKALMMAKDTSKSLESSLMETSVEKEKLDRETNEKKAVIAQLRNELITERNLREQTALQLELLTKEYSSMQITCREELVALRQELASLRSGYREECVQIRTAKEDIILFNDQQEDKSHVIASEQFKLQELRAQQVELFKTTTLDLQKTIQETRNTLEDKSEDVEGLRAQLAALKESLRVIKTE